MSRLDAILSEIFSLSTMEESILLNILEERKVLKGYASDTRNEVRENRFSRVNVVLIVRAKLCARMVLTRENNVMPARAAIRLSVI